MPLTKPSRDVVFIGTSPIVDRVKLVKTDIELEKFIASSTDIDLNILY